MRNLATWAVVAAMLMSCADEKAVNAAFFQNKVSWYVYQPASPTGVDELAGFAQPLKVVWKPADRAVFTTDLADTGEGVAAAAASHLGLLILDDADGLLHLSRPASDPALGAYSTGVLFRWDRKTFVTLGRDLALDDDGTSVPAVALAWWSKGNERLAFYPLPSQMRDPRRQLTGVQLKAPLDAGQGLVLVWKSVHAASWSWSATQLNLSTGEEQPLADVPPPPSEAALSPVFDALSQRLASRLGGGFPVASAGPVPGNPHLLLVTPQGWAASGLVGDAEVKLYRLPELGAAGRYTHAAALKHGYVVAWETRSRGYVGAAGVVYVPYAVLAP